MEAVRHPVAIRTPGLPARRSPDTYARELLATAGVTVGGTAPWDIAVHDDHLYARVLADGPIGLGESYMDGWWDALAVDQMLDRLIRANLSRRIAGSLRLAGYAAAAKLINLQNRARAHTVAEHHYNATDDVFEAMLDARRVYSCAYWPGVTTLEEAQEAKLDLICRKVGLQPGMHVLDIGCGWGGFARYAAERYGVQVTATNIAERQIDYARKVCEGLPVEVRREDYRDTAGRFDAVVSVGMFEHVGSKNHRSFMQAMHRCLADGGVGLLHSITSARRMHLGGSWVRRYIFPNGEVPTLSQIAKAAEGLLVVEDVHNLGPNYDRTLMAWHDRFEAAWPRLRERYDERFRRMWRYYLLSSAAGFRSRQLELCQVVLTRTGRAQPTARLT